MKLLNRLRWRLRGEGRTAAEARYAAARRFGNATAALEQSRDQWGFTWLGALALLLTISGMYGVMAYLAGQRTREIGIRIALGATPAMVLRLVMRHAVKLIMAGLGMGLVLSLGATKVIISLIEIPKVLLWDTGAAAAGLALVLAAALVAAFLPSRRASRVDPMSTLRAE